MSRPEGIRDLLSRVSEAWNDPTNRYRRLKALEGSLERLGPHPDPIGIKDRLSHYETGIYSGIWSMLNEFETHLYSRRLDSDLRGRLISACRLIGQLCPEEVRSRRHSRKSEKKSAKAYYVDIGDKALLRDIRERREIRLWAVLGD